MSLTRKEFLGSMIGLASGAAGAVLLVGCGGDEASGDAGATSCSMNGSTTEIGGNHGHMLVVSKADIAAGVSKTYDITGSADHAHSVAIGASFFAMLQNNMAVTTSSSTVDSHSHSIMVTCL